MGGFDSGGQNNDKVDASEEESNAFVFAGK
ncbi:hypothetical protein A2U01_0089752, partial [Trifolium medium]|nr:hypothetical protein [Trifolium medium]